MPIIVDEVIISVEVSNQDASAPAEGASAGGGAVERQALIEECVERVLVILRERGEP